MVGQALEVLVLGSLVQINSQKFKNKTRSPWPPAGKTA